jgi:hypothetical protein
MNVNARIIVVVGAVTYNIFLETPNGICVASGQW